MTLDQIGAELGVGRERVRSLLAKAQQSGSLPEWTYGLEVRLANALVVAGFTNKDQLREAIVRGDRIRRFKAASLARVEEWLRQY